MQYRVCKKESRVDLTLLHFMSCHIVRREEKKFRDENSTWRKSRRKKGENTNSFMYSQILTSENIVYNVQKMKKGKQDMKEGQGNEFCNQSQSY